MQVSLVSLFVKWYIHVLSQQGFKHTISQSRSTELDKTWIKPQRLVFMMRMTSIMSQGGYWSGKSQGNLIFLQGQGKVREFCKLVREILNNKKVREKSGNFIILAQNMCCSRYFDYLKCEKSVNFFSRSLRSLETMKTC